MRQLEDCLVRQEVEKEERTRDWLLEEAPQQPQKRLKRMNLLMQVVVKKAGKRVSEEKAKKVGFKFNKKGKRMKKEEKEIKKKRKKTSLTGSLPRKV